MNTRLHPIVGSYPQPEWLIDRERLKASLPPRVRAQTLWRAPEPWLSDAQDAATLVAIRDQEEAGIDIVGDGEMRRESYSNRLATALSGIDNPGTTIDRTGKANPAPRVVGPIVRIGPIEAQDVAFLKHHAMGVVKINPPGPFTMTQQALNDFYASNEDLALAYADAGNAEIRDLFAAAADIVQLDEPYLQARPEAARDDAIAAIARAVEGGRGARRCTAASATPTSTPAAPSRGATTSWPSWTPARWTLSRSRRRSPGSIRRFSPDCRPRR